MKIFNKLISGFFVIASIILFSSLFGAWSINRVNSSLNYVTNRTWLAANAAMQISIDNLTRIMAQEEYMRGNKEQAKFWIQKSEQSLAQNFQLLKQTGLADDKMIANIKDLYEKLDKLQKLTHQIFNQRNKAKLQLDENAIIWTKTIEKLKYRIDTVKEKAPETYQAVTSKIIDISILSLSERAALNNFLSGFMSDTEYVTMNEGFKNSLRRRLEELNDFDPLTKEHLSPVQNVHLETERLLETLYNQHKTYKTLQTELSFNTLRLVESLEMIKEMMNAKMADAASGGRKIARTSRLSFVIFTVIGFLAALITGIVASKVITKPIISLTSVTERIAQGRLEERVAITSRDEIGSLGNSFNRMAGEIMAVTAEIKQKNLQLEGSNQKLLQANRELQAAFEELQGKTARLNSLNEELQKASRLKSEFLANMSHELKTPLNAIIGFTKLVLKHAGTLLSQDQRNNLNNVLTSAEQLLKLINDILDLSKIEAGKMPVYIAPFDLEETIDHAISMVTQTARDKRLTLHTQVADDLHKVFSDQDKVRQILINLLSNSVKFTDEGSITVTAHKEQRAAGAYGVTACAVITVTDTGIGIDAKDRRIIFDDFTQADGSITRRYGGSGLGLSISKKLANILGGDITVESTPGIGSTFTFFFPIDVEVEDEAAREEKQRRELVAQGLKTIVLAIDDNQEFLATMEKLLTGQGFQIVQASNGYDGLAKAKVLMPDIITIDILLPKKSGWDILQELKSDPRTRNIPIIIISIVDKKELSAKSGFSEYLQKPVRREVLLKTLTKYIPPSKTILIVDNDTALCDKIQTELGKEGLRVLSAADGKTGLELLKRYRPHLVLLEVQTPECDGYYFLAELKNSEEFAPTPVIILSKKDFAADEKEKLERLVLKIIGKDEFTLRNISEELLITLKSLTR